MDKKDLEKELKIIEHTFLTNLKGNKSLDKLRTLYINGELQDKEIEDALSKRAKREARKYFEFMINKENHAYADHVGRPEVLAYGIENRVFTNKELDLIPFDHGDNQFSFCRRYGKDNLPRQLLQELMGIEPPIEPQKRENSSHLTGYSAIYWKM